MPDLRGYCASGKVSSGPGVHSYMDAWHILMPTLSTRKEEQARIALLQGTLDLLILRTLLFGQGRKQLVAESLQWRRLTAAIGRILGPEEA